MATFEIPDKDIKRLREALSEGQFQLTQWMPSNYLGYVDLLQQLLNQCDRHRPLGPGGKHGDLHTKTCGCEDKGHGEWCDRIWIQGRPLEGITLEYECEHVQESDSDDYY